MSELLYSILSGFLFGLLGSFHCVGMCGPLALSLPMQDDSRKTFFSSMSFYHVGRIITYGIIGIIFGLAGSQFRVWGFQQVISVLSGMLLLLFLFFRTNRFYRISFLHHFIQKIQLSLHNLISSRPGIRTYFSIGLLNGLLPCGLVYAAVIAALASSHILTGGLVMISFGIGTVPLMAALMIFGHSVSMQHRILIQKAMPYFVSIMAGMLILRGLNLGIPVLSPRMEHAANKVKSCHGTEVAPSGLLIKMLQ